MNETNKGYLALLKDLNVTVDENYALNMRIDNEYYPLKIDGMKVYLPVDAVLDTNVMDKVFFHPACESIISRETEIFKLIRKLAGMALLDMFLKMPAPLFDYSQKKTTKSMRADVLDIIEPLREMKEADRKAIKELFAKMEVEIGDDNVDKRFVHFSITKGGKSKLTNDKLYYRTKPTFPFFDELARKQARSEDLPRNQKVTVFGQSVTLSVLDAAVHIFRSILPDIDSGDAYAGESVRVDCARLTSFFNAYALLANDVNSMQNLFRAQFDKAGIYGLPLSFIEHLDNIGDFYRQVGTLPYNSQTAGGSAESEDKSGLINSVIETNSNQWAAPVQQQQYGNNQQQQNAAPSNVADGHQAVVRGMMGPNEQYQNWRWDPTRGNGRFIHMTMTQAGPISYEISREGNFLSREYSMQNNQYNNYNHYNQQMQNNPHAQYQDPYQRREPNYGNAAPSVYHDSVQSTGGIQW